jgi:hypothetical protein
MGLLPNSIFDEFFLILAETPLKKTHKYSVLISFFQKVVGKIGENWRKSGFGSSPFISAGFEFTSLCNLAIIFPEIFLKLPSYPAWTIATTFFAKS